jgi:DNA-directed RNA polymerase specialized sigma subunit
LKTEYDPYRLAQQLAKAKTAGRHYRDDVLGDAFLAVAEGASTRDEIENAIRCAVIKEWTYSDRHGPICDIHEPIGPPERAKFDVWGEVYRLPPRQRLAIELVFCEGFTEEESAVRMGCTDIAVHRLLDRAIQRLRKIFCAPVRKNAFRFP